MRSLTLKDWKTRLLCAAGALFLLTAAPAKAGFGQNQSEDTGYLVSRLNQLENQVQTLSRALYKGAPLPAPAVSAPIPQGELSPGMAASYEDRLGQLENRLRQMTGQIEQLSYDMQQLKGRMNKLASDNDARFRQMDGGGPSYTAPQASRTGNRGYSRLPPGEEDYEDREPPRGKVLGTMSPSSGRDAAGALYDDAFNDIRDAKYDSAAVKFQRFMDNYPRHPLAANAQYWLAETYYVKQDYRNGARLFAQNYQDYPQSPKASASLLKLGLSLARLGKKEDACLSLQQLKKEFPGDQTPEITRAEREMKQLGCKG